MNLASWIVYMWNSLVHVSHFFTQHCPGQQAVWIIKAMEINRLALPHSYYSACTDITLALPLLWAPDG